MGDVSTKDLIDLQNSDKKKVANVLEKLIKLSDIFYKNGFSGLRYIPIKTRLGIFISAQVYKGIGNKIKKNNYRYDLQRTYLNNYEKLWITIISIPKFFLIKYIYKNYTSLRDTFRNENL